MDAQEIDWLREEPSQGLELGSCLGTVLKGRSPSMSDPTCISLLIAMKVSPSVWLVVEMLDPELEFVWKGGRICKGERKFTVTEGHEKKPGQRVTVVHGSAHQTFF